MANLNYNKLFAILGGSFDWSDGAQTYRVLLATSAYTPAATHNFVSDVTNELSGGGYARQDVTGRSITEDDGNSRADYDATNTTFSGLSSTQTFRWLILYRFITNDASSPLMIAFDFGASGINLTGLTSWTSQWNGGVSSGTVFRTSS